MKEKIEEIVNKYTKSPMAFADGVERVTFQERYFPISDLVKELSTLIQAERKDAVEGFVDNIGWKKPSEVIDIADDVIDGRSLVKQMEAYLQSLDKGDTDDR